MIEYASMAVSKLLVQAGFDKQPGADVDGFYTDEGDGLLKSGRDDPLPRLDQDGVVILDHYPAYRADTLGAWLTAHGYWVKVYATVNVPDCCVEAGKYPMKKRSQLSWTGHGATVCDALGRIVAQVLGAEP